MKIKSIKPIIKTQIRYDLKVDGYSCYYANGILIHNTDGQQLSISWRDDKGGLIAARNKGHLKNRGENALTPEQLIEKFAGRGGLSKAYAEAITDLEKAIKGLSSKQKEKIFNDGRKFMSLEVIHPDSVNVVPYGEPMLVFHNTFEYDGDGNIIGSDYSDAKLLSDMITDINQNIQNEYTIKGPPVLELPKEKDLSDKKERYKNVLRKLQREFNLKGSDGISEYHQEWWKRWIRENAPTDVPPGVMFGLVKRWAFDDKSFSLNKKNIDNDTLLNWAKTTDKLDRNKYVKQNTEKFENIFLGVGAEILSFIKTALSVNPDKTVRDMRNNLNQTIADIRSTGETDKIDKLEKQLERLQSIGGVDKIVPTEGIVFNYKKDGQIYTMKLTGTFAPLNQLMGILKFNN